MRDPSVLTKSRQAPNRPTGIYYSPLTTTPVSSSTVLRELTLLLLVVADECSFFASEELNHPKFIDLFFANI
jgi:hypothetical protein